MKTFRISRQAALLTCAIITLAVAGCMPRFLSDQLPDVVVVARVPTTTQVPSPGSDAHFVMVDDYFVMEQQLTEQYYVYAALGKLLVAATEQNGYQGKFRRSLDGQEVTTKYFAKTRKATEADYVFGREVFFLNYLDNFGNYRAPESPDEARNGWWVKARVTDTSETHKGFLSVSGGFNVNLNALRVAVP